MNSGFLIGMVFLVISVGVGAYVIGYQSVVLTPLAEKEMAEMVELDCKGIVEKKTGGLFWSVDNYKWAVAKTNACGGK